MSEEIWVTYRDVADYPRKQFEVMAPPPAEALTVKNQKIPGEFGYPDMYIAWHHQNIKGSMVHLVTYTEHKLRQSEINNLLRLALKFAQEEN